jgi:hypothetical protein
MLRMKNTVITIAAQNQWFLSSGTGSCSGSVDAPYTNPASSERGLAVVQ